MNSELQNVTSVTILRQFAGFVFDAVFEEVHTRKLHLTTHPLYNGDVVADHAVIEPKRLRICAGVSDAKLSNNPDDSFVSASGRARKAFDILCDLQRNAEPFSVQTGLFLYTNMICTSLRARQDKINPRALYFEAELSEVLYDQGLEQLELMTLPDIAEQASSLVNLGFLQAKSLSSARQQLANNVAKKLLEGFF